MKKQQAEGGPVNETMCNDGDCSNSCVVTTKYKQNPSREPDLEGGWGGAFTVYMYSCIQHYPNMCIQLYIYTVKPSL